MQNVDDDFLLEVVLKTIINKVALGEAAPKLAAGVVIKCYDRRKQKHTENASGGTMAQKFRRIASSAGVAEGR